MSPAKLFRREWVHLSTYMHQYFSSNSTGHRRTGNVIRELNTPLECSSYCIRKPSECKSINYRAMKRRDYSINSQLINATEAAHPQSLLADQSYDHYKPIVVTVQKVSTVS